MDPPVYSICITHYNNARTLRAALDSVLAQVDSRFEIVVVDNFSTDGSREILDEYARAGKIDTLVEKHCSRGLGWQTAVENAKGKYVLVDLDMDDEFRPELEHLVEFYHSRCEGCVLAAVADLESAWSKNVTVGPRDLILELGGWPDLQFYEHSNLWGRADLKGLYRWTNFSLVTSVGEHEDRKSSFGRFRFRYMRYRDLYRQDRIWIVKGERTKFEARMAMRLARVAAFFMKSYAKSTNTHFRPRDTSTFVKFEA